MDFRRSIPADATGIAKLEAEIFSDAWSYRDVQDLICTEGSMCFSAVDEGEVVAVFYFAGGPDPTYGTIYDGEWISDEPYAVIHRVAVKHHGRGIIDFIFSECFNAAGHLRIDTHRDNLPMQKVLKRAGFEYCGIIHLESGAERMAFEKIN